MTSLDLFPTLGSQARKPAPRKRTGPTPEGAVMQALLGAKGRKGYLHHCRLGRVLRHNVGAMKLETGRVVRFGEVGKADIEIQLAGDPRSVWIEVKRPGWTPPKEPRPGSTRSTWAKWQHHLDQVAFLGREEARGNVAFFATSVADVYERLTAAGFEVPRP